MKVTALPFPGSAYCHLTSLDTPAPTACALRPRLSCPCGQEGPGSSVVDAARMRMGRARASPRHRGVAELGGCLNFLRQGPLAPSHLSVCETGFSLPCVFKRLEQGEAHGKRSQALGRDGL